MTAPIRLALVGLGKIARDQHLPAIAANSGVELVAIVSRHGELPDDVPCFADIQDLLSAGVKVDAVSLCTPPQVRHAIATTAITAGLHVFLEKPPATTLTEVAVLDDLARRHGVTLFASWHSRFAAAVDPARAWLADRAIQGVTITWREDVRIWHPGQDWIWEPGGFGVFDPGINALSIATRILPGDVIVETAELDVPTNRAAPIAARLQCRTSRGAPIFADFDFRQEGPQTWDIAVDTPDGRLILSSGGANLSIAGSSIDLAGRGAHDEYAGLYGQFERLVRSGSSDVDVRPLRLVADAFLRARFQHVEDFIY